MIIQLFIAKRYYATGNNHGIMVYYYYSINSLQSERYVVENMEIIENTLKSGAEITNSRNCKPMLKTNKIVTL
jgi:hypothetical protein